MLAVSRITPAQLASRRDITVAPSILSADFANLGAALAAIENVTDVVHVDVMDGHFVPNLTIGPPVVAALRPHSSAYFDCHLMMDNPGDFLEAFATAGADGCSVHAELDDQVGGLLAETRRLGLGAGLVLNPGTPFAAAQPYLEQIDVLLVMSVVPGFGGQSFITEVLETVRAARAAIDARGLQVAVEIDGGIAPNTVGAAVSAGARMLVAGNAVYGAADPAVATRELHDLASAALWAR